MPWTPDEYRAKHNKKLSLEQAASAAKQAAAMIRAGVPEGEAIATTNKRFVGGGSGKSLSDLISKRKPTP